MNVSSHESVFGLLSTQPQKQKETKTAIWLGREVKQLVDKFSPLRIIAKVSVVALIFFGMYRLAYLMSRKRKRDESATGETTNLEERDKKNENRELLTSRSSRSHIIAKASVVALISFVMYRLAYLMSRKVK